MTIKDTDTRKETILNITSKISENVRGNMRLRESILLPHYYLKTSL